MVVVDLAGPGLSGAETVRRARERWPGLRVLYVTGYADLAGNERRTGADPLIKKPFRLEELRAAVRRALRKSRAGEGKNVVPLRKRGQRGKEISGRGVPGAPVQNDHVNWIIESSGTQRGGPCG